MIDLLGERRHFIAQGKLSEYRAALGGEYQINKGVTIKGEAEYAILNGEGNILSWRPLFMGAGIDDLRDDSLPIQSAGLGSVALGLTHRLGRFVIDYKFEQIIPIWTRYKEGISPPSPGTKTQKTQGGEDVQFFIGVCVLTDRTD